MDLELAFITMQMIIEFLFLFFAENIVCGCSLEPPRWEHTQSLFLNSNKNDNEYPC